MITISRDSGIKVIKFPDGQPHVTISGVEAGNEVKMVWPIRNGQEAVELLMIIEALEGLLAQAIILVVPYLMGARSDRRMEHGGSVGLKVVANMINSCNFDQVHLLDVHSPVALQLIDRSINYDNEHLIKQYKDRESVLIIPDAGAAKRADQYQQWLGGQLMDAVQCMKHRDIGTGRIELTVLESERCRNKNCVIIDDLCDGGATFLAVAKQIKPKKLTLIVTHGIFSKGFTALSKDFHKIITTNSFREFGGWQGEAPALQIIPAMELFQ